MKMKLQLILIAICCFTLRCTGQVPPQVNGFTVMLSGQRATFSWERNLAYGNYILYYEIHNGAAEFYEETKVSLKRTINLYNAKTSFTVSNLAHGASYSATIYQKYLNLKGLSTGFSFPVEPRKLANLAVVEGTSSSVTITWDHQIIDFTNADFIVEYSCDNWATIQNTRAPSPSVTIEGLNYFPASYKIRVRTQIFDTFLNYRNEGPNSEPLEYSPPKPCIYSCLGQRNGDYQSCRGCDVYAICCNSTLYDNRPCAYGLIWDDDKKRCDFTSSTCEQE